MAGSQEIIDRLKAYIPGFGGRVQSAADYLRLTQTGGEVQQSPVAFVIPSGITGGQHSGLVGAYRQTVERLWSIVIALRSDTGGLRALEAADEMIDAVIDALVGWDIGTVGVFTFRRAQLIKSPPGTLAWEITFAVQDHIRKVTP